MDKVDNLVMRSYYVDAKTEQELDQFAYRNRVSKAAYIRLALAFSVEVLKRYDGEMSPETFEQELNNLLFFVEPIEKK